MKKLKVWLAIAAVFVAGFVAGVVVTRGVVRHFVREIVMNPDRVRDLIEKRMAANLRLDREQRAKAHDILLHTQGELRSLRGAFQPRFEAIMEHAQSEIAATLTPEQRQKLEKFREENQHLWRPR